MRFNPIALGEELGKAAGEVIKARTADMERRLTEMSVRLEGMQARLDKCAQFAGAFEPAQDYAKGALVKHGDGLYIAIKAVRSGGSVRDGSGWQKLN